MPKIGYAKYVRSSGRDQALPFRIGTSVATRKLVNTRDSPAKLVVAAVAAAVYAWRQQQKIVGSDTEANDYFGYSVSIYGDSAIVGAYLEDASGNNAGAAYIFTRSGSTWTQQQKIVGNDTATGDQFGNSVSIYGDSAIVGAYYEDASGGFAGAAYIFKKNGSNVWEEEQKIVGNDTATNDQFGNSVSIYGDSAIVGAPYEDASGSNAGAAYIFTRSGSTWTQQQKIVGNDTATDDLFGYSVSIYGDSAIVGARLEDANDSNTGAAYIFTRSGNTWTQQQKIVGNDTEANDYFGNSVSIYSDSAIVGAPYEDAIGSNAGAAYIFNKVQIN